MGTSIPHIIEILGFVAGLGFSLFVYSHSIRKSGLPPARKAVYFLFTSIGITGTLWLAGVLIAHFLRQGRFNAAGF